MIKEISTDINIPHSNNENQYGLIYKRTSPSGKIYIGQTTQSVNKRWNQENSAARTNNKNQPPLFAALRKYNYDFENEIILDKIPINLLDSYEVFYIKYYKTYNDGYNCTPGGAATRGKQHPRYGKKHKSETKQLISQASKKNWKNKDYRENVALRLSESHNSTGYFRVHKSKDKRYVKGYRYIYQYQMNGKVKRFVATNIPKLEIKIKNNNLPWIKLQVKI